MPFLRQNKNCEISLLSGYNGSVENTDWSDIQASLRGDNAAFERLILRYQQQIAQLCWRFSPDAAVCERLVQDTFVEAYLSLKTYKGKGAFIGWLKIIATRAGYRFWKEQDKERRLIPLDDLDFPAAENKHQIEPEKAAEILNALLEKLDTKERLVLTLMYLEECSIKTIAERMGWTVAGTKMRAMRARNKLKKIVEKESRLSGLENLEWIE